MRPYPVHETIRQRNLARRQALVVSVLKPGVVMANAAGVNAAAAGWSRNIPSIHDGQTLRSVAYFATVTEFADFSVRGSRLWSFVPA